MKFCVLASGSTGNALYVGTEQAHLLIDVGISMRTTIQSLRTIGVELEDLTSVLVTHEHQDHVRGLGAIARKTKVPIHATEGTWEAMPSGVGSIAEEQRNVLGTQEILWFGDLQVETFQISHDAREPIAFTFTQGGRKLALITDLGYVSNRIRDAMHDADVIVLETNHDTEMLRMGRYPWHLKRRILGDKGHLSNVDAGIALCEVLKQRPIDVYMAHQSQENNVPELAEITVKNVLQDAGCWTADLIRLHQTYASKSTALHTIA